MKRSFVIVCVCVIGCILFLQAGCGEQAKKTGEPVISKTSSDVEQKKTDVAVNDEQGEPRITFEKVVHDFEKINPGSKNSCVFKFTNTGDGTLKVEKKIAAACSCTIPQLSKGEYAPGESGQVKVVYSAGMHAGPTKRVLYVKSNDKTTPKVELTIQAKIVTQVECTPTILNLSLKEENGGCPEITLSSIDNNLFAIKKFKSSSGCITAEVDPEKKARKFVLEPKVDMEKLSKSLKGTIVISLDHPKCKDVTVNFMALAKFATEPPLIFVPGLEPEKPITREVWVLSNYNEEFEVESTSTKNDSVKVLSSEKVGNRYKFMLEITPPQIEAGKPKILMEEFSVNMKSGDKAQLQIMGAYKKPDENITGKN